MMTLPTIEQFLEAAAAAPPHEPDAAPSPSYEQARAQWLAQRGAAAGTTIGRLLEASDVLNGLVCDIPDADLIDRVDWIMNELFVNKRLTCPGHRWLNEPLTTIRGHLISLFESGCLYRDGAHWRWRKSCSRFVVR